MLSNSGRIDPRAAWSRLRAYLTLPHPTAVLLVMLATALFGLLASGGRPRPARFGLLLLAMLAGQIAIGALNEYCDRELDAGKPHKPIPAGLIAPRTALLITIGALLLMLVIAARLGWASLLLLCLAIGAGLVYDLWLKRTRWSWLPYLIALPLVPIWAWTTMERFDARLLLLYPLGATMVVAVHLAQSLPDAESDRSAGVGSLVARLGRTRSLHLCRSATGLAALEVAIAGSLLGGRPLAALAAGGVTLLLVAATLVVHGLDRQLFPLMGACALILGTGLILSLGV